jgi:putative transposase
MHRSHKLDWEQLRRHVEAHPDRTQAERARHFQVSRHCIWNALHKLAVTHKKRMGYQERDPQQRKQFLRQRERFFRRGKQPVHIDECGFASSTARRYGYAPKGQRVDGLVSGHRRPRTSLLAARMAERLEEPLLFEGTCDTVVFNTWLQTRLCPRLNAQHLVILDNTTFHKSPETAQHIAATGATLLFLPPYSPDFNPIEHDFAALKKHQEYHETASLDEIVRNLSINTGLAIAQTFTATRPNETWVTTSPISRRRKGGYIWRRSKICIRVRWSGMRWGPG